MKKPSAIAIDPDSVHPGTCRSCGQAIEWAKPFGRLTSIPFNPPIVLLPALRYDLDEPAVARVDLSRTTSHFASCPQADEWRRQR